MFSLLRGLHHHLTRRPNFYIIIIGLDNAGKTTLLENIKSTYLGGEMTSPEKIAPTVGLNIGKIEMKGSQIHFWDLGGQRDLQPMWSKYYTDCHGIIFVIDATARNRLQQVQEAFEMLITNDDVEGVPILMLANKQDVTGAMQVEDVKEVFNRIASKLGARDSRVMTISALRGDGVREAIEWMYIRIKSNTEDRLPVYE